MMASDYVLAMKPSSEEHILSEWIRTEFNLPPSMVSQCKEFFLRIWQGDYVVNSVIDGMFPQNGKLWNIHWQSTPEVCRSASRVACSFREYKGKRFVVIKVWKGEEV